MAVRSAKQRAAQRKAALASARKRRKGFKTKARKVAKRAAIGAAVGAVAAGAFIGDDYAYSKSRKYRNAKTKVKYNKAGRRRIRKPGR
jgi:hypothetical protein